MKKCGVLLSLALLTSATASANEDVKFSLSTGAPFLINAELSYKPQDSQVRYYGVLKSGSFFSDDGFAIGFETPFSNNNKHAFGAYFGSIGVVPGGDVCKETENSDTPLAESIACILVAAAFDWERVDGIGVSYSYNFNELHNDSWFVRLEAGYGKGNESNNDDVTGGLLFGYRF